MIRAPNGVLEARIIIASPEPESKFGIKNVAPASPAPVKIHGTKPFGLVSSNRVLEEITESKSKFTVAAPECKK